MDCGIRQPAQLVGAMSAFVGPCMPSFPMIDNNDDGQQQGTNVGSGMERYGRDRVNTARRDAFGGAIDFEEWFGKAGPTTICHFAQRALSAIGSATPDSIINSLATRAEIENPSQSLRNALPYATKCTGCRPGCFSPPTRVVLAKHGATKNDRRGTPEGRPGVRSPLICKPSTRQLLMQSTTFATPQIRAESMTRLLWMNSSNRSATVFHGSSDHT